jgi:hypothetical protein
MSARGQPPQRSRKRRATDPAQPSMFDPPTPPVADGDALPVPAQRPERAGAAAVTYTDARSLLTSAAGFIQAHKFTLNPYGGCGFACLY